MELDTQDWGRKQQVQCHACGGYGHKANKCPSSNKNNAPKTGATGKNHQNRGNREYSQQQQQQQQGNAPKQSKHCNNCPHLSNHTTDECKKRPQAQNANATNKQANRQQNNVQARTFSVDQHSRPMFNNPSVSYCAACNMTGHCVEICRNDDALIKLHQSRFYCTLCEAKGHVSIDCKNPHPKRCSNCHKPGHSVSECRAEKDPRQLYFGDNTRRAGERFQWRLPGPVNGWVLAPGQKLRMELNRLKDESRRNGQQLSSEFLIHAEAMIKQANASMFRASHFQNGGPSNPVYQSPYNNFAAPQPAGSFIRRSSVALLQDAQRNRAIQEQIDRSAKSYPKHNAQQVIIDGGPKAVKANLLTENNLLHAKMRMGSCRSTFFRDPRAIEAIAMQQRARCRTCKTNAFFLDKGFRTIPIDVDVLTLDDYIDWGLFIMFDCRCCDKGGYDFFPYCQDVDMAG